MLPALTQQHKRFTHRPGNSSPDAGSLFGSLLLFVSKIEPLGVETGNKAALTAFHQGKRGKPPTFLSHPRPLSLGPIRPPLRVRRILT